MELPFFWNDGSNSFITIKITTPFLNYGFYKMVISQKSNQKIDYGCFADYSILECVSKLSKK